MATAADLPAWGSEETRAKVALCLERFDFRRVAAMMAAVAWTWRDAPTPPTEDEIEGMATELLVASHRDTAAAGERMSCSSGGLTATWHRDESADGMRRWWPELSFVGEASDGYTGDECE